MAQYFLSIRRFSLLVATAALLLLGVGCGGSGDAKTVADAGGEISVETGSLSKADFVKQVDGMCVETKGEFEQRARKLSELAAANGEKELQFNQQTAGIMVRNALAPSYEGMIDEIRTLGAPSGDEEEVAAFLNAMQADLDYASKQPVKAFQEGEGTPFVKSKKTGNAYGLAGCVETFG